ncbi:hypothetical protein GCM10009551_072850 [Nocardiopsis tropica]|uniref:DGQHR domain-containing protein n=1 Tax=Tsukamurella strandjordii TaxID=147577 RepID=UPI0031D3CF92
MEIPDEWCVLMEGQFRREMRRRASGYESLAIRPQDVPDALERGWEIEKRLKRTVRIRKLKDGVVALRDRVWVMLAKLGFDTITCAPEIQLIPGNTAATFSIAAADDEVVLLVKCEYASDATSGSLIDVGRGLREESDMVHAAVRKIFPGKKAKFLVVTQNMLISSATRAELKYSGYEHMDEDVVEYYYGLAEHLGTAGRYQFLGSLFANQKIPGLESRVLAVEGRMGGHRYYSFTIEPERLLKLAYVLHRSKANSEMMPTYQRLIRKSRLRDVAGFVSGGGFFPNSLIVNVDSHGRGGLQFDPAKVRFDVDSGRVGTLHLPQTYRALYVIDGQHRLYGYAGLESAMKDKIPVVAFVDLPRVEQVRMFMDINEQQQAVPKNLRSTLNSDLLWGSKDPRERTEAIRLRIAQAMGEERDSPLFGRVVVGEDLKTSLRCVTVSAIDAGIARGNLVTSFNKSTVRRQGILNRDDVDDTYALVKSYVSSCMWRVRDGVPLQWNLGSAEGGFLFMNNGVEALLRLFSDALEHAVKIDSSLAECDDVGHLVDSVAGVLDGLILVLNGISFEDGSQLRRQYGGGGANGMLRALQAELTSVIPSFDPAGLSDYLASQDRRYVTEAFNVISEVESFLKNDVKGRLRGEFGELWFKKGVPIAVQKKAGELAVEKNLDRDLTEEVHPWDCMYLTQYRDIFTASPDLWSKLFASQYGSPRVPKGQWKKASEWLIRFNLVRNKCAHSEPVSEDDFEFVVAVRSWLAEHNGGNLL